MKREPTIPLFLWIASALCLHALSGGGAHEVAQVLGEKFDVAAFAREARSLARLSSKPTEIDLEPLIEETTPDAEAPPPDAKASEQPTEKEPDAPDHSLDEKPKTEKKPEPEKPKPKTEKKPELEKPKSEPEKPKPELEKAPTPPPPELDGRIAVQQHVEDKNQEDNPTARHAAEHANRVEVETRARDTATDQNHPTPTPRTGQAGPSGAPGNSTETRVAQSEEREGERRAPSDPTDSPMARGTTTPPTPSSQETQRASAPPQAQRETQARAEQREVAHSPNLLDAPDGAFGAPRAADPRAAQRAQKQLPGRKQNTLTDLLGYGSEMRTARGINLNLSPASAQAVIGVDKLAALDKKRSEKRLSQHRGSFQNLGIERWKPALENYVATVQPGNQTALNAARVPFATYLNEIHNRIHPIFADGFLAQLATLPPNHPLNNPDMSTHLELALSATDGRIVKMGITKTSGVTMFDVGALDSVNRASPFGVPPGAIVSSDGNVYLHWEFHRKEQYACSTYFARPFILNLKPSNAPPEVEPPHVPHEGTDTEKHGQTPSDPISPRG